MDLALETSTRLGGAVLAWGPGANAIVHQQALRDDRAHASDLVPLIARLLETAGRDAADLRRIFVGLGPGSYTGLRVAVATAIGLTIGMPSGANGELEPPALFGVPSAEALLFAHLAPGEQGLWLSDARSDTLYALVAARTDLGLDVQVALSILARGAAADLRAAHPHARLLTDPSSESALRATLGEDAALFRAMDPNAHDVWQLGRARIKVGMQPTAPGDLEPLYLREFAAKVAKR